jgi:type IV secretion system protein VirB1
MGGTALSAAVFLGHLAACAQHYPVIQSAPPLRALAHAMAESRLHPYAIHDNTSGQSFFPDVAARAVALARELLQAGHRLDAGVMQVSDANWAAYGLSVDSVFDERANICVGARILGEAFQIERRAACRYNTGRPDCANGYPERVQRAGAKIGRIDPAQAPTPSPQPPPPPPCAPLWDQWALAVCSAQRNAADRKEAASAAPIGLASVETKP